MRNSDDGIYVFRSDNGRYELDAAGRGFTQLLFTEGSTQAGTWKPNPSGRQGGGAHELAARETIVVLAGTVRIEIEDRPTLELETGDIASLPKGAITTWHPSDDFEEFFIYS